MKIPKNAIIPDAKLTKYLLIFRERDDKSKFLAQAGFTLDNPEQLKAAICQLSTGAKLITYRTGKMPVLRAIFYANIFAYLLN